MPTHRRTACLLCSFAAVVLSACDRPQTPPAEPPLSVPPARIQELRLPSGTPGDLEPSGLLLFDNRLLIVSDNDAFPDIYQLDPLDEHALLVNTFLSLSGLPASAATDFEGLTFCAGRFFIVEESTTSLIAVDPGGAAAAHPLDFAPIHKEHNFAYPFGTPGAGLEGVACDEPNGILYVALERMFRMIYALRLSGFAPFDFFDVPAGWNAPRYVDGLPVYPDYSGLFFENGFLYALQRNDRTILKIDPVAKRLLSRLVLDYSESDLYDYSLPFGMAEGLVLTPQHIYVALDNNGLPRLADPQNTSPLLLTFPRPPNF